MEEQNNKFYEVDILQLFAAIWHRIWAVIIAAVIGAGVGFSVAEFAIAPKYTAQALLYVNNTVSVGGTSVSISASQLTAAQNLVDTYIVILESRSTMNDVIKKAAVDYSYAEMCDMVSAKSVNNTEIFSIAVVGHDPEEATRIANVIADLLPDKISEIVDNSSVRIVDYAVVPATKSSPNTVRFSLVGLVLAAAVVCAIIIIRELTDTQIRSEDYLIQTYHLPILAVIPDLFSTGKRGYYSKYSAYGDTESSKKKGGKGNG